MNLQLQDIKPKDDLICVPKFADASRYRYIYYPDRLNRLPAAGEGLLTRLSHVFANRALFAGLPSAAIHDFFNPTQPAPTADESIGHFVTRRFNAAPANKIVSAILHGIYAGDLNKLSVRSLFPVLPYLEGRFGSVIAGIGALGGSKTKIMEKRLWEVTSDPEIKNIDRPMVDLMSQSTVFTLHSGLGALATRLEEVLNGEERVQIKMSTPISGLGAAIEGETGRSTPTFGKIDVFTGSQNQPTAYDTVISTIPHNQFAAMLPSSSASKPPSIPSVTVMVVNLWFRNPNLLSRTPGFGYLIPRSIPYHQNPECALGVIFDGYAAPNQDLPHAREQREKYTRGSGSAEEAVMTGTKMTVMMGGHWWDGWTDFPGEEEAVNMARTVVARHLGIVEEPEQTMATLQRDCIPQYTVGHGERMKDFHYRLLREYGGNLRVAGGSYGGVGVNDCIRSAWDLGKEVREKGWRGGVTGLERYTVNNGMAEFVEVKVDKMPDRADVKARE